METVTTFLINNFLYLFALVFAWVVIAMGFRLWRHRKFGLKFPAGELADAKFIEKFASGKSLSSIRTRMGGASNCLTIAVTQAELWVYTFFPFNVFAQQFDLEHKIPLGMIRSVKPDGRAVIIEYEKPDGSVSRLSLYLRRTPDFLRALSSSSIELPPSP